jgi:hypothetical protein
MNKEAYKKIMDAARAALLEKYGMPFTQLTEEQQNAYIYDLIRTFIDEKKKARE